jgi:CRISPR system Cascade subunit CasD
MTQFLTFALVAPLASFGSLAVATRRPTWDRPGRSAVLGLIGACLGVDRDDDAGQAALAQDYSVALLCHSPGRPLADFHTVQVPPTKRGRSFATRRAELGASDLSTVVTRRDYRTGGWHIAAIWSRHEPARWTLAEIAQAMDRPKFVTYLGRKSCPLGLPLAPRIEEAEDALAALEYRHRTGPEAVIRTFDGRELLRDILADVKTEAIITLDADDPAASGARHVRTEFRRDEPVSRRRWQFGTREEAILSVGGGQ